MTTFDSNEKTAQNPSANRKASIQVNAVLNFIKAGCSVIFPLITFPYASRILQVENLGKVNYGQSIVSYFALFAALGINTYGVREGARKKAGNNFDAFASEIFSLNLFTTAIAYAALFLGLLAVPKLRDYRTVILILSASIVLTTFGIEWVNTVFEDFFYITVRSIFVQLLCMGALFVFIKTPEDYLKYACLTVLPAGITAIANWFYCRRYTSIRIIFNRSIFSHLRSMFVFFANSLAITIYVSADMTMLGWISGDYYAGLYSVSVKIYQIIKVMMTAIYTVTIPRLSRLAASEKWNQYRSLLTDISSYIILLIFPCMAGIIAYAEQIILLISGQSYVPAAGSLRILAVALLFAVASGITVNCINTPNRLEKSSLYATIAAAATNIILNIFIIPVFRQNGAAMTTVAAEMMVLIICLVRLKDVSHYLHAGKLLKQFLHAALGFVLVILISTCLKKVIPSAIGSLACGLVLCPAAYAAALLLLRNEYFLGLISSVFKKLKRN